MGQLWITEFPDMCKEDGVYNTHGKMKREPRRQTLVTRAKSRMECHLNLDRKQMWKLLSHKISQSYMKQTCSSPTASFVWVLSTFFSCLQPTDAAIPWFPHGVQETQPPIHTYVAAFIEGMTTLESQQPKAILPYILFIILVSNTILKLCCISGQRKRDKWRRPPKKTHLRRFADSDTDNEPLEPNHPIQETGAPGALRTEATDYWDYYQSGIQVLKRILFQRPAQREAEKPPTKKPKQPENNTPSESSGIGSMRQYVTVEIFWKRNTQLLKLSTDTHRTLSDVIVSASEKTTYLTDGRQFYYGRPRRPVAELTSNELTAPPPTEVQFFVKDRK